MASALKTVIVTGGNGGIGWEAVKALYESAKPYYIFMGSRSTSKGEEAKQLLEKECPTAKNTIEVLGLDIDSDESIEQAYKQVEQSRGVVDCLVNNAGANYDIDYLKGKVSLRDSFMKAYNTNVAGTNVMTHVFMPLLLKSSDPRLIFVTGLSAINQAGKKYFPARDIPAGWPKPNPGFEVIGYRASKCALNMLMLDWDYKLKKDGVKVWALGPGMLITNLGGFGKEKAEAMGAGPASAGGDIIRRVVEGERDADTGKIVVKDGGILDW